MTMIESATGWFEIFKILAFNLDEVTEGNYEYIDKSSTRVIQLFNNAWMCIYPCPHKVVFDVGSKFKQYFTPLIKDFDIKPVVISVNNTQANAPAERVHQLI